MQEREGIYQLHLEKFCESDEKVDKEKERRERREPYLTLSLSRMEVAAQYLDSPGVKVEDPRKIATDAHIKILAGLAFHQIVQATSLWRYACPRDTRGIVEMYYKNLERIPEVIPTERLPSVRTIRDQLFDERLAFPNIRGWESAKHTIYEIIADKVLGSVKAHQPFTDTPAFPQFAKDPRLAGEIPFPNPVEINTAWNDRNMDQEVIAWTGNLLNYQEDKVVLPIDFARVPGYCFLEPRVFSVMHPLSCVWSARFDEVAFGSNEITVTDYKTGRPFIPPKGSFRRKALRIATWLTAQSALSLGKMKDEKGIRADGKAVNVDFRYRPFDPGPNVRVRYLGFSSNPVSEMDLSKYWHHDWEFTGRSRMVWDELEKFVGKIREDMDRLAPIFS